MINVLSIIVPIYNAQDTLRRCVKSILAQIYRDIEVLLIDDGSDDDSGQIADEFLEDNRVKVFHKENGGLSSARNYGLDRAKGDFIAFVDADDWIEPETYETVMAHIADICVFGRSTEYPGMKKTWCPSESIETIDSEEAIKRLVADRSIGYAVWDKVYRKELFQDIRFPEGYNYEEVRTTYKLLGKAERITLIPDVLYHYVQYEGSIVHSWTAKNWLDYWTAFYEIYLAFGGYGEKYRKTGVLKCVRSIFWAWGSLCKADKITQESQQVKEMVVFARRHRKERMKIHYKLVMLLAATGTRWSMFCAYILEKLYRVLRPPQKLYRVEEIKES